VTDYPTPTWADIDRFCRADGWTNVGTTDHVQWQKVLSGGEVLKTHRSLAANKVIKPNRFGVILREQLQVSRQQFWETINSGTPVDRPVALDEAPVQYPGWLIWQLKRYGYSEEDVRKLTPEDAQALLWEKRAEPTDSPN
jgi:hypothetical protein